MITDGMKTLIGKNITNSPVMRNLLFQIYLKQGENMVSN